MPHKGGSATSNYPLGKGLVNTVCWFRTYNTTCRGGHVDGLAGRFPSHKSLAISGIVREEKPVTSRNSLIRFLPP